MRTDILDDVGVRLPVEVLQVVGREDVDVLVARHAREVADLRSARVVDPPSPLGEQANASDARSKEGSRDGMTPNMTPRGRRWVEASGDAPSACRPT